MDNTGDSAKGAAQVLQSFSLLQTPAQLQQQSQQQQQLTPVQQQPQTHQQSEPQNLSTGTQTVVMATQVTQQQQQWHLAAPGGQQHQHILYQTNGQTNVPQTDSASQQQQPAQQQQEHLRHQQHQSQQTQQHQQQHIANNQQTQTSEHQQQQQQEQQMATSQLVTLQPATLEHSIWSTPGIGDSLVVDLQSNMDDSTLNANDITEGEEIETKPIIKKEVKKKRKLADLLAEGIDPTKLEENSGQVKDRFGKGCECDGDNCFKNMNCEFVFRHRLNIAELTKNEHDMYLMGVTMACLANPEETSRHKERKRLRASYVFQGKKICLDAFLYLENCTHYQLKAIRKHVMVNGVTPRVHGNHGKKPPNTFPLDTYQHAAAFLQSYITRYSPNSSNSKKVNKTGKAPPVYLPVEITRKKIHNAYREYCEHFEPDVKIMGYSSFRHFMKEQFQNVKFFRMDKKMDRNKDSDDDDDEPLPNALTEHQANLERQRAAEAAAAAAAAAAQASQQQAQQQQQQNNSQDVNAGNKDRKNTPPVSSSHNITNSVSTPSSSISISNHNNITTNTAINNNNRNNNNHQAALAAGVPTNSAAPLSATLSLPPPPPHAPGVTMAHPSMVAASAPGSIYPAYSHVQLPLNLQTQQPLYSACMQPFPPGQPHPPPPQTRPTSFPYTNL